MKVELRMTDILTNNVLLYISLFVTGLCFVQALYLYKLVPKIQRRGQHRLWIATGLILILVSIDHQVGMGLKIADFGRKVAIIEGWYEDRRPVQAWVIVVITITWVWYAIAMLRWSRHGKLISCLVMLNCSFILGFTSIRMISLHQIDAWLNVSVLGLRRASFLELIGVVAIGLVALSNLVHRVWTTPLGTKHPH